jgi:integrase
VLTDDEVRRIWRVLERIPSTEEKQAPGRSRAKGTKDDPLCPISEAHAAILKLRLLTAQRGGEVAQMRWSDLDLQSSWWTIPAAHVKNKRAHRVPLTDRVKAIIEAQPRQGDAVFSSAGSARDRAKKAPTAIARTLDLKDFRGHDLRRTASTRMGEARIPRQHIAYVLNHADGTPRATQVYDRYEHDNEKRIALEAWERALIDRLFEHRAQRRGRRINRPRFARYNRPWTRSRRRCATWMISHANRSPCRVA